MKKRGRQIFSKIVRASKLTKQRKWDINNAHLDRRKTKKSQVYYNKSARDLNELKPGETVRVVKPETLVKRQEWKKGTVTQSHGYRSYDVNVEGKVLRRNRVHLKPDKQVKITEPSLKSEEQKPKDQSAPPTNQSMHVKPTKQTAKTWKLNAPIWN